MLFDDETPISLTFGCTDSNTPERLEIDAEIDTLYEKIRLLKSKRNTLAPISRLPTELLCRIFYILQASYGIENKKYYGWTVVSWISRYWRAVAMERSDLWGGIVEQQTYHLSPWTQLSLDRSGSSPLDVTFERVNPMDTHSKFVISVLEQLPRIRTLKFSPSRAAAYSNQHSMQKVLQCLEQPAPIIEEVSLGSHEGGVWLWFSQFLSAFSLFKGDAPLLRSLTLTQCQMDWDSPIFQNLHHLKFNGFPSHDSVSLHSILDILVNARHLRTLHVSGSMYRTPDTHPAHDLVTLPFLGSLTLSLPRTETITFLSSMVIPATTYIEISVPDYRNQWDGNNFTSTDSPLEQQLEQLFGALTRCRSGSPHDIGQLNISVNQRIFGHADFQLGSEPTQPFTTRTTSKRPISLQIQVQGYDRWLKSCSHLPLSQLRSLYLWFDARSDPNPHLGYDEEEDSEKVEPSVLDFSQMPLLAEVTAQGPFISWFTSCLRLQPQSFPSLESLTFRPVSTSRTEIESVLTAVHEALKQRAEVEPVTTDSGLGFGKGKSVLKELKIVGVNESIVKGDMGLEESVERLRSLVDALEIYKEPELWLTLV